MRHCGNGESMKARVKWVEGVSFVGESGSGHAVVIDGAPEHGGRNLGVRPMELVLMGAAACTAFDVVHDPQEGAPADRRLRRSRPRPSARRPIPQVFTQIHLKYTVAGRGLDPHQVERAVKLSKDKYCSATHDARARPPRSPTRSRSSTATACRRAVQRLRRA